MPFFFPSASSFQTCFTNALNMLAGAETGKKAVSPAFQTYPEDLGSAQGAAVGEY